MRRIILPVIAVLVIMQPGAPKADVWNMTGGIGYSRLNGNTNNEKKDSLVLNLSPSYKSVSWEFSLDLNLRWDTDDGSFFSEEWNRKGAWLRPLNKLGYRTIDESWSVYLLQYGQMTLGSGQTLRGLVGGAEVNYSLPGIYLERTTRTTTFQVFVDQAIDPGVGGFSFTWEPRPELVFSLEGAIDPTAPLEWSGGFSRGRPEADSEDAVYGYGGEGKARFYDSILLDLALFMNAGVLNDTQGAGVGFMADMDFSQAYQHRLSLKASSVLCKNGYVPAYFDELYKIERWGVNGETLLQINPLDGSGPDRMMLMTRLGYRLGEFFNLEGRYDQFDDKSMKRAGLLLSLLEEGGKGIEALVWSRSDDKDEELFQKNVNLFTRVSALYNLFPHLLLKLNYEYSWAFLEEAGGAVPASDLVLLAQYTISF